MEGFCTALSSLMSVSSHSHEPCPRPVASWHAPPGTPSVAQEATSKDALLLPTRAYSNSSVAPPRCSAPSGPHSPFPRESRNGVYGGGETHFGGPMAAVELHRGNERMIVDRSWIVDRGG